MISSRTSYVMPSKSFLCWTVWMTYERSQTLDCQLTGMFSFTEKQMFIVDYVHGYNRKIKQILPNRDAIIQPNECHVIYFFAQRQWCVHLNWLSFIRYPEARAIQRKLIFHAGPTNSGKTYQAIQRYLAAKSGVYCGPLKLLAHEIFEKSNTAVCI